MNITPMEEISAPTGVTGTKNGDGDNQANGSTSAPVEGNNQANGSASAPGESDEEDEEDDAPSDSESETSEVEEETGKDEIPPAVAEEVIDDRQEEESQSEEEEEPEDVAVRVKRIPRTARTVVERVRDEDMDTVLARKRVHSDTTNASNVEKKQRDDHDGNEVIPSESTDPPGGGNT